MGRPTRTTRALLDLNASLDTCWRGCGLGGGFSHGGLARSAGPSLVRQRHTHGALAVRLDGGEQDLADATVQIAPVDALADFLVNSPAALAPPACDLVNGRVDGVEIGWKRKELVAHGDASTAGVKASANERRWFALMRLKARGFSNPSSPRAAHGAVVTLSPLARKPESLRLGTFPLFRSV